MVEGGGKRRHGTESPAYPDNTTGTKRHEAHEKYGGIIYWRKIDAIDGRYQITENTWGMPFAQKNRRKRALANLPT